MQIKKVSSSKLNKMFNFLMSYMYIKQPTKTNNTEIQ